MTVVEISFGMYLQMGSNVQEFTFGLIIHIQMDVIQELADVSHGLTRPQSYEDDVFVANQSLQIAKYIFIFHCTYFCANLFYCEWVHGTCRFGEFCDCWSLVEGKTRRLLKLIKDIPRCP